MRQRPHKVPTGRAMKSPLPGPPLHRPPVHRTRYLGTTRRPPAARLKPEPPPQAGNSPCAPRPRRRARSRLPSASSPLTRPTGRPGRRPTPCPPIPDLAGPGCNLRWAPRRTPRRTCRVRSERAIRRPPPPDRNQPGSSPFQRTSPVQPRPFFRRVTTTRDPRPSPQSPAVAPRHRSRPAPSRSRPGRRVRGDATTRFASGAPNPVPRGPGTPLRRTDPPGEAGRPAPQPSARRAGGNVIPVHPRPPNTRGRI